MSGAATKRLARELSQLRASPPDGIRVVVDDSDISNVVGWVQGPQGTPFEGGYFKIKFQFGPSFPEQPPKAWFATKIFHPNVAPSTGEICVSTLKKDWKKDYGVGHILITVKCLLIHPNPESALHEEAGKLLLEAYDDYARHARLMTDVHARYRPAEFTSVASSSSYQPYPVTTTVSKVSSSTSSKSSALPAVATVIPLQASSTVNGDVTMQELATSAPMKSGLSSSGSSTSTVPKKRGPPTASAIPNAPALTHGVLGASSAGMMSGNAGARKPLPQSSATQAAKKKALKRL